MVEPLRVQIATRLQREVARVFEVRIVLESRPVTAPREAECLADDAEVLPARMAIVPVLFARRVEDRDVEREAEVVPAVPTAGVRDDVVTADRLFGAPLRVERVLLRVRSQSLRDEERQAVIRALPQQLAGLVHHHGMEWCEASFVETLQRRECRRGCHCWTRWLYGGSRSCRRARGRRRRHGCGWWR